MKNYFKVILLLGLIIFAFGCINQSKQQETIETTSKEVLNNQPTPTSESISEENFKDTSTEIPISEDDIPQIDEIPSDIDEAFTGMEEI